MVLRIALLLLLLATGCTGTVTAPSHGATRHFSPTQTKSDLDELKKNWVYGHGIGETALNIGTAVVFPPYALLLVGNAGLVLSGHEPLRLSEALPGGLREGWRGVYDGVTSVPGRVSAGINDEEFRDREVVAASLANIRTRLQGAVTDGKDRSSN